MESPYEKMVLVDDVDVTSDAMWVGLNHDVVFFFIFLQLEKKGDEVFEGSPWNLLYMFRILWWSHQPEIWNE